MSTVKKFGTAPVFFTSISTILGAVLFLRFGWAVGAVGLWGTLAIILIGHLVTIPTALAVAEIATNQKVEGGGAYYMISRSFGLNIGAAIGIALFLSQAISVAFYVIAFAEAFDPFLHALQMRYGEVIHTWKFGWILFDKRLITIPTTLLLILLMLYKGADLGMKFLYLVVTILFLSLILFFAGGEVTQWEGGGSVIDPRTDFFYVFAVIFPAFTGMAAGIGLSGDLKEPRKSIPLGTVAATIAGMVIYVLVTIKLHASAPKELLLRDQLVMSRIALWGPIIPIGLACATISSALGSIIIAPRTLQALANDRIFPAKHINDWLAAGKSPNNEPVNSSLITGIIAIAIAIVGDINFVASIISMFFMVTYGAICLISFLEHFAADPSYRPAFKSKWYLSLLGALMCFWLMFQMDALYAFLSIVIMVGIYQWVTYYNKERRGMAVIFQGVIFQISRWLQVTLLKAEKEERADNWRPAVVCISKDTFDRIAPFDMLRYMSHRYGFGTYIHFIEDYLSKNSHLQAEKVMQRLIKMASTTKSDVFLDTIISPSYTSAVAQVIQMPGFSGHANNMIMFEFSKVKPDNLKQIIDNFPLVRAVNFDIAVLGTSEKGFGHRHEIHIWITSNDYENANLMILLGYVILGHPEWENGFIRLYAITPEKEMEIQRKRLPELVTSGRLPISVNNIELIAQKSDTRPKSLINEYSSMADFTIVGFRTEAIKKLGEEVFLGYDDVGNILFVNSAFEKEISTL